METRLAWALKDSRVLMHCSTTGGLHSGHLTACNLLDGFGRNAMLFMTPMCQTVVSSLAQALHHLQIHGLLELVCALSPDLCQLCLVLLKRLLCQSNLYLLQWTMLYLCCQQPHCTQEEAACYSAQAHPLYHKQHVVLYRPCDQLHHRL